MEDERLQRNIPPAEGGRAGNRAIRPFRLPLIPKEPSVEKTTFGQPEEVFTGEGIPVEPGGISVIQAVQPDSVIPGGETEEIFSEKSICVQPEAPVTGEDSAEPEPEQEGGSGSDFPRKEPRKFFLKRIKAVHRSGEPGDRKTGMAVPLRYKTFKEAMSGLRDFHPLPSELILTQTPHHSTWLMTQLKKISTKEELEELAFSLSHKDLSLLFTTLSTKKRRDEIDQIQNLIRLRASHYLYLCGWLTYQFCYPRSSVARALSDLCMILEDLLYVRESRQQNHRNERKLLSLPVVSIGEDRMIWSRIPLISQISLPNSRHFIADIANEIIESKTDIETFFKEYAIQRGQPLANAIETRYREMVTGVSANPLLSSDFFDRFRR